MSVEQLMPMFSEPVADAQQIFRRLLSAMAEPGTRQNLSSLPGVSTKQVGAYAIALCLVDNTTTVWLSPAFSSSSFKQSLAFHCGCRYVESAQQAQFVFVHEHELDQVVDSLSVGSDRDPEFSATAIVHIETWDQGVEQIWSGPGIQYSKKVTLPFTPYFWQQRKQKNQFPRGIDVLVVGEQCVLGLPRTTVVQEGDADVCRR